MSFDLAVWYEPDPDAITAEEADAKYLRLCDGDATDAGEHASIERFVEELSARYPDLDELPEDEIESSPWSGGFERSGAHVLMTMRWSAANDVIDLIAALAKKHGLVLYDPQDGRLHRPSGG